MVLSPDYPVFKKATVRFFGGFNVDERQRIGQHEDTSGNLVVTVHDDVIEVAFDSSDHVYTLPIARR